MTTSIGTKERPLGRSGSNWATLKVGGVRGEEAVAGGQLLLYLDLTWGCSEAERTRVEAIQVHMEHQGATLGTASLKWLTQDRREDLEPRLPIRIQVTETTLSELENRRTAGEGIELFAKIRAFVRSSHQGPDMVSTHFKLALPESKWNDILSDMEYLESYIVRFPLGGEAIPELLSEAVESYREARDLHRQGHYEQSIGKCREVFEHLPDEIPFDAPFGSKGPGGEDFENCRGWKPYDRLENVKDSLRHVTHVGHHSMDGKDMGEADSRFLLTTIGALLNRTMDNT